jgi:hypothetical protein
MCCCLAHANTDVLLRGYAIATFDNIFVVMSGYQFSYVMHAILFADICITFLSL